MPLAVITVDEVDRKEAGYYHFKDKSQKAWNCNKPELFDLFVPGERIYIDYNEGKPKEGRKYGSKYINRARNWKPEDGDNSWPDKEPYTGGGSHSGGSKVTKKDYDPEVGKKQTAANCAMVWCGQHAQTLDDLALWFPAVADIVYKWVNEPPKSGLGDSGNEEPLRDGFNDF